MNEVPVKEDSGRQQGNSPKLTACVLLRKHDADIQRCLNSIKRIADEIIIVDSRAGRGNTDLEPQQGIKVIKGKWEEDFSALRNAALQQATGDWVLSLDAHEWLEPAARRAIRRVMAFGAEDGWLILIRNFVGSPELGECFLRRSCRLFRNTPNTRFVRTVYETIEPSITRNGGAIGVLEGAQINNPGYISQPIADDPDYTTRIRLLRKEIRANPEDVEQLFNLGNEYYAAGDYPNARLCLSKASEKVVASDPCAPLVFSLLIVSLREMGKPKEGIVAAERALAMGLQSAELSFARAWAHMALRESPEAAYHFDVALKLSRLPFSLHAASDPTIRQYRGAMGLALALLESGRPSDALVHARAAVSGCPQRPEPLVLLGCVYQFLGKAGQALMAMEKALAIEPGHPDALALALPLYQETGRLPDALTLMNKLLDKHPENSDLLLRRGAVFAEMGLNTQAVSDAVAARALAPKSAGALVDAGRILASCSDYKEAINCFEEAMQLAPSDPGAYFNAGDVLYKMGAYLDAAEVYGRALELDPRNAAGYFALGNSMVKCGRLEAAIKCWSITLDLSPDFESARSNLKMARKALAKAA